MATPTGEPLHLDPVAGPDCSTVRIAPGDACTLGRSAGSSVVLLHERVSRRHALVQGRADRWFITDAGSTTGTRLNGVPLSRGVPAELAHGDLLGIGPWSFRVRRGSAPGHERTSVTIEDSDSPRTIIEADHAPVTSAAQRRLDQFIACSERLMQETTQDGMARAALESLVGPGGYARGAVLRATDHLASVEVLASVDSQAANRGAPQDPFRFSRSLIRRARDGQAAAIIEPAGAGAQVGAQSIVDLDIRSALCIPVFVSTSVVNLVYLDSRAVEQSAGQEFSLFCRAVARMYGMALGNRLRAEVDERRIALEAEITAARKAQQQILPPERGLLRGIRWAMRSIPGWFVAGDLMDVFPLDGGRAALTIGDVTGAGAGAGILMAMAQSHLHSGLMRDPDPGRAVSDLNRYMAARETEGRFATLWVGVWDPARRSISYVDAGHGHWLVRRAGGLTTKPDSPHGIPVGIDSAQLFPTGELALAPGDRLVLYSDGLVEQRSPSGEMFGAARVADVVAAGATADDDAASLADAVAHFSGGGSLNDDTTIASFEFE
ncbi:MAG: SpoIIE family protein phosphatase [Phycisphaerae bacterium]|nr:SpoIIE family protein phosphatase [Phycisphaerae bacterium]